MSEAILSLPVRVLYPSEYSIAWKAFRTFPTLEESFLTRPPPPGSLQIQLPPAVEVALQYSTAATASTQLSTFSHTEGLAFEASTDLGESKGKQVTISRRFVVDTYGDLKVHETSDYPDWIVRTIYKPGSAR